MIFIAEIGLNHNGNFGLFHELIKQAALAGADIAKFQLGWRDRVDEINPIRKNDIEDIIQISEYYGIEWMFSILSEDAFSRIRPFNPKRYKIASRTVVDNPDLVKTIVNEGRETFISLGMWEKKDLPDFMGSNIKYIWCKSLYPTPPWELTEMPKDFLNSPYSGFSDHSIGIEASLLAISRGAKVIEKHFSLDKSDTTIRDHALSLIPKEFALLVESGRQLENLLKLGV